MEKPVKGIRENYYNRIVEDYQQEREKSFLYRIFWVESARELLKESLPPLPKKKEFREQMKKLDEGFLRLLADGKNGPEQMGEHFARLPEEARGLLKVHLPQLPEGIVKLLKEHSRQLPEEVEGLLTERFPWLLGEEVSWLRHRARIMGLLEENLRKRPEWARGALIQTPPQGTGQEQQKKERREFWAELMLNDAGYKEGLITDTEYYLWLTEYLAARDIYYKDTSIPNGHKWLYELLHMGLGREPEESVMLDEARKLGKEIEKLGKDIEELEKEITELEESRKCQESGSSEHLRQLEKARKRKESRKLEKIGELEGLRAPKEISEPERRPRSARDIRDKAGVGRDLAELAEKFRHEAETKGSEISNRLHSLKHEIETGKGETRTVDYLPWLTRQLERMAIHIKVKTWLQDNGYPIVDDKEKKRDEAKETKKPLQDCRRQDFSMRLFETYCDSEKGYDFISKEEGGRAADEGWTVRNGFCMWEPDGLENHLRALLRALEQKGREDFYIPLAMDLHSGCVFFLAGKGYYTEVYDKCEAVELKKEWMNQDAFFCYDYLRLDRKDSEDTKNPEDAKNREDIANPEVAFRLQPTFHENAGKSYDEVLSDFKWYCGSGRDKQVTARDIDNGKGYYFEEVDDNPRQKIKAYNEDVFTGIPKGLQWAFDGLEDMEPSQKAKDALRRTRKRIEKDRMLMR